LFSDIFSFGGKANEPRYDYNCYFNYTKAKKQLFDGYSELCRYEHLKKLRVAGLMRYLDDINSCVESVSHRETDKHSCALRIIRGFAEKSLPETLEQIRVFDHLSSTQMKGSEVRRKLRLTRKAVCGPRRKEFERVYVALIKSRAVDKLRLGEVKSRKLLAGSSQPKLLTTKQPVAAPTPEHEALLPLRESLTEMRRLAGRIRSAKIRIPLGDMTGLLEQIIAHLREHPDKIEAMRQFTAYYLPTSVKLLSDYEELEANPAKSAEIGGALGRIEELFAKMPGVFRSEYEALFGKRVMDINAEVGVMKAMIDEGS
jgi:hypothetical protein